jgi:outer membrane usher protein
MSTRACVLAELLAVVISTASLAAHAEEPLRLKLATALALPRRAAYEALIVEVSVNRQKRGEFTVHRDESGEYYVRPVELQALGLAGRAAAHRIVLIDGEDWVSLRSLGPQKVELDEPRLALEIEFPAPALQKSTYDFTPRRPGGPQGPREPGAFLNYRLSASDGSGAEPFKVGLANELAVRVGDTLVRNETVVVNGAGSTRGLRYATQIVHDRPAEQQRLVIGDHTAASGELGSTLAVGGVSFSKLYQLTPHFVRQPLAGYAGAVSTPSQVEVRMGGVPVFREQVPAGPFELRNLQQFAGARDVEIVVRDALGREQMIGFPYYFADQALREGLHEYSYSAGALREDLGVRSNHYGAGVLSGVHRYGLSDRVTLGVRGEAAAGLRNFGPTALYRDNRFGAFSAGLSGSRHDGRSGQATSFGHVYQTPRFGLRSNARRYSDDYAVAQDLVAPSGLKAEYGLGGSLALGGAGSVFLDRTITKRRASALTPDSAATRLSYTYSMGRRGSLFVTLARVHAERAETQAFIGLLVTLDRAKTLHLSARHEGSRGEAYGAQLASAVPVGEGLGYRLGYDGVAGEDAREIHGFMQYNARAASLTLDAAAARNSGAGAERYEVAVAGAATWAGGRLGLTRQIEDSFVAVQLAAPLEGVRVYSNNQEVGRTDRGGRLIVPNVGSFQETQIAIDESDVPLDHMIGAMRRVVVPAYRSGSLLHFDVRRLRAVEGVLLVRSRQGLRPAENALVQIGEQQVMTGRGGRYYIEDLPPGRHQARLGDCRFFIVVPDSNEPVATLPEVIACE